MGKTEKRELVSRLTVLLLHLLKWRHQPAGRGNSWRLSIANARDEIADLIADNPSLKAVLDEVMDLRLPLCASQGGDRDGDGGRRHFRRSVRGVLRKRRTRGSGRSSGEWRGGNYVVYLWRVNGR